MRLQSLPRTGVRTLFLLFLVAGAPKAFAQTPPGFPDVPSGFWAAPAITDDVENGIAAGFPDGTFRPEKTLTRAEFARMIVLARGLKIPATVSSPPAPDVATTSWEAPYVQAALQSGIVVLAEGQDFRPHAPITKEAMAAMVGRSLALETMAATAPAAPFSDTGTADPWARGYLSVVKELGIMNGLADGTFRPLASSTRAQGAAAADQVYRLTPSALRGDLAKLAQSVTVKAPQSTLASGSTETVETTVLGPGGEILPVTPTLSAVGGTITPSGIFTAGGPGTAIITATLGTLTAQATITITAPDPPSASLTPIEGKGIWLLDADVMDKYGAENVVQTAQRDGIHTLYVEVGSTYNNQGFWGGPALSALLPLAHEDGIAVIGWIYDTLENPSADLALAQEAYTYNVDGQTVDGLALDLETDSTMTPAVVGPFDAALRAELGPGALLVACTYPPQSRPNYPYATLAQTFNAVAPMDYWHSQEIPYTAAQAESYVETSITELRSLSGVPTWPVAVIGQTYDMFSSSGTGANSPTAAEIEGAMAGAQAEGAIGFSVYRWATATTVEQNAFLDTPFTPTLP